MIGSTNASAGGRWLDDGTIVYADQDGRLLRWTDPDSGPLRDLEVGFCLYPTLLADDTEILCGGGAWKFAYSRATDAVESLLFWTRSAATGQPGAPVRGSQFRVVDGEWLVYLTIDGTLNSLPGTAFLIQVFSSPAGEADQARAYEGSVTTAATIVSLGEVSSCGCCMLAVLATGIVASSTSPSLWRTGFAVFGSKKLRAVLIILASWSTLTAIIDAFLWSLNTRLFLRLPKSFFLSAKASKIDS